MTSNPDPAGGGFVFRPLPILTAASAFALAVLIGLGVWQLQRHAWKAELLAQLEARRSAPTISLAAAIERVRRGEDARFQPVALSGRYLHQYEARAPEVVDGVSGWRLVTPFLLEDARWIVFVDRGVAPAGAVASERGAARPEGTVEIEAIVRPPAGLNAFTPPPQPETRTIYALDRDALAALSGFDTDEVAPFVVSATREEAPPGARWPRPDPPSLDEIANRHFEYALTWFGLALALIGVYLAFHFRAGRLGRPR